MKFVNKVLSEIYRILIRAEWNRKSADYQKKFNLHPTVKIGNDPQLFFEGNISIGEGTYFNSGTIQTGYQSEVVIGKWCAIGYNVNILSITHSINNPTGPKEIRESHEKSIYIGDHVWIGSNVFIREGVRIGNHSIIAANSVVTKNIPENSVVGGVPAKLIKELKC